MNCDKSIFTNVSDESFLSLLIVELLLMQYRPATRLCTWRLVTATAQSSPIWSHLERTWTSWTRYTLAYYTFSSMYCWL